MRSAFVPLLALVACEFRGRQSQDHRASAPTQGQVRRYFIAADEVEWDYAPSGINRITGRRFDDGANVFVQRGENRIGSRYRKALYREYTDGTFKALVPRDERWEHLGLLGPLLRANVGDTFEIHFRNNTQRPISMHPHGVFYDKANEGAPYDDGTSNADKADDAIRAGATYVYRWSVPDSAGPGPHDPSSIMWMYHSHTDEIADTNAGLVGPMIITAAGRGNPDGVPTDIDREFVATFWVINESKNPFTPKNTHADDEDFNESNLKHAINGYLYGNTPGLVMKRGDRVRWYLMAMGSEVDLHTPHWHGNTVLLSGMRTDVAWLLPATMAVADMNAMNPGAWLFHCHVDDHIEAGMLATYNVAPD